MRVRSVVFPYLFVKFVVPYISVRSVVVPYISVRSVLVFGICVRFVEEQQQTLTKMPRTTTNLTQM
jgi:hypothetical protein